jgi:flagellin
MPVESVFAINNNMAANSIARTVSESALRLQKSILRFSSGLRIASPQDDVAGLAQAIRLDAQIDRSSAAQTNLANATSFSQTQDGALQQVQQALNRMGELSVLAQDGTKTDADRSNLQQEFIGLQSFVSDVTGQSFNGVNLFSSSGQEVTDDGDGGTFSSQAIDLAASGSAGGLADVIAGISVSTAADAANALGAIKTGIDNLSGLRAGVGANLERASVASEGLSVQQENLSAASSRIKDVDIAAEAGNFAAAQLLLAASSSKLIQANRLPQTGLNLLA